MAKIDKRDQAANQAEETKKQQAIADRMKRRDARKQQIEANRVQMQDASSNNSRNVAKLVKVAILMPRWR